MRAILSLTASTLVLLAGACATEIDGIGDPEGTDDEGTGSGSGGTTDCIEGPCTPATPTPTDDPASAVDSACAGNDPVAVPDLLVPKWTPLAPTVPNECLRGFEMNRLEQYTHTISSAQGSRALTLEVDIATYTASDAIRISAIDGGGNATILVDTCRMRTATYADPTGGTVRPPEETIRDFRVAMPAGTKQLVIDNSNASTPTYIRILGLCDFDLQAPPATELNTSFFRVVTSR
jgi:hypothetical protein